jgi:hypothetical protein
MAQKRLEAKMIHTHTFPLSEVPTAIRYARDRVDGCDQGRREDALTISECLTPNAGLAALVPPGHGRRLAHVGAGDNVGELV